MLPPQQCVESLFTFCFFHIRIYIHIYSADLVKYGAYFWHNENKWRKTYFAEAKLLHASGRVWGITKPERKRKNAK